MVVMRFYPSSPWWQMNIECRHCASGWSVPGIDSVPVVAIFKECDPEVRARSVRRLKELLGLSMMEAKRLAMHVTTTKGRCFHCQTSLLLNEKVIKRCQGCGAINLDIYNA